MKRRAAAHLPRSFESTNTMATPRPLPRALISAVGVGTLPAFLMGWAIGVLNPLTGMSQIRIYGWPQYGGGNHEWSENCSLFVEV